MPRITNFRYQRELKDYRAQQFHSIENERQTWKDC